MGAQTRLENSPEIFVLFITQNRNTIPLRSMDPFFVPDQCQLPDIRGVPHRFCLHNRPLSLNVSSSFDVEQFSPFQPDATLSMSKWNTARNKSPAGAKNQKGPRRDSLLSNKCFTNPGCWTMCAMEGWKFCFSHRLSTSSDPASMEAVCAPEPRGGSPETLFNWSSL